MIGFLQLLLLLPASNFFFQEKHDPVTAQRKWTCKVCLTVEDAEKLKPFYRGRHKQNRYSCRSCDTERPNSYWLCSLLHKNVLVPTEESRRAPEAHRCQICPFTLHEILSSVAFWSSVPVCLLLVLTLSIGFFLKSLLCQLKIKLPVAHTQWVATVAVIVVEKKMRVQQMIVSFATVSIPVVA